MKHKFWNWVRNDNEERILMLHGEISDETWFGDEVTPGLFRDELNACEGDVTVWINSPGGDCFAAAQIYNMLMEYPGKVNVRIDGIAASAASVIAMAGTTVEMSPVAMMMIHNPATVSIGDEAEMKKAITMLAEVKESIINAYEMKTGLPRQKISNLMNAESWMNAKKAVELGFADSILYSKNDNDEEQVSDSLAPLIFSRAAVTNSLADRLRARIQAIEPVIPVEPNVQENMEPDSRVDASTLKARLNLIQTLI